MKNTNSIKKLMVKKSTELGEKIFKLNRWFQNILNNSKSLLPKINKTLINQIVIVYLFLMELIMLFFLMMKPISINLVSNLYNFHQKILNSVEHIFDCESFK